MKAEDSLKSPLLNLRQPDGVRPQTNEVITEVLVGNQWIPIVPGSFHFYISNEDPKKAVPFIQFDVDSDDSGFLAGKRIEVFPQTVGGYAYTPKVEEE